MAFFRNHKPALTILLIGALLCTGVVLFSFAPASNWLETQGLHFTNLNQLREYWEPEIPNSTDKPPRKPDLTVPVTAKNLDSGALDRIGQIKTKLQYLENFVSADHTALDLFFASLAETGNKPVHIWYYGDSQIEGDRLTGELRSLFQGKFGGKGTGYTPFSDLATYRHLELYPSPALQKYNCFNFKSNKSYGFAGKSFRFLPDDSSHSTTNSLKIHKSLSYDKLILLYGKHNGGTVVFRTHDSSYKLDLPAAEHSGRLLLSEAKYHGKISLELPADGFYSGLSFEGNTGVQIDNCGIRGHSGDGLRFISDQVILSEAQAANTKLVVFHFGNNMIPYIKGDNASMEYYKRFFKGIFNRYRKLLPDVSILVVSAGDMGTVADNEEKAYPFVDRLAETMRTAALETGCAFFDAHSMIARDGGILGWKKLGYAGLDGHLSPAGQMKYASTLFAELMREYEVYKIIHQQP